MTVQTYSLSCTSVLFSKARWLKLNANETEPLRLRARTIKHYEVCSECFVCINKINCLFHTYILLHFYWLECFFFFLSSNITASVLMLLTLVNSLDVTVHCCTHTTLSQLTQLLLHFFFLMVSSAKLFIVSAN